MGWLRRERCWVCERGAAAPLRLLLLLAFVLHATFWEQRLRVLLLSGVVLQLCGVCRSSGSKPSSSSTRRTCSGSRMRARSQ